MASDRTLTASDVGAYSNTNSNSWAVLGQFTPTTATQTGPVTNLFNYKLISVIIMYGDYKTVYTLPWATISEGGYYDFVLFYDTSYTCTFQIVFKSGTQIEYSIKYVTSNWSSTAKGVKIVGSLATQS